jgi:hypothetical protein
MAGGAKDVQCTANTVGTRCNRSLCFNRASLFDAGHGGLTR